MRFIEGSPGMDSRGVNSEKPLPVGVSAQQHAFLLDANESGACKSLDPRREKLINTYYSNDVSTSELCTTAGVKSRQGVNRLIKSGMETLWNSMPEFVRARYIKEDVIKLKDTAAICAEKVSRARRGSRLSPETRKKMSETKKGKPSPMKGRNHSPETRAKMSENQRLRRQKTEHIIFDSKA